mmetsp:Transcript_1760/g.3543  ORF Transcript_1760/g.3543 Transcript_1760/m.3543 type:complete len:234 (-) Transcript_1760:789-1490(-)
MRSSESRPSRSSALSSAASPPASEVLSSATSSAACFSESNSLNSIKGFRSVSRSSFCLAITCLPQSRAANKRPRRSVKDRWVEQRASKMSCRGCNACCNSGRELMYAQCRSSTRCIQPQMTWLYVRCCIRRCAHSWSKSNASWPESCATVLSMTLRSAVWSTLLIELGSFDRNPCRTIGAMERPPDAARLPSGNIAALFAAPPSSSASPSRFRFVCFRATVASRGPNTVGACG